MLWGHLPVVGKIVRSQPADMHAHHMHMFMYLSDPDILATGLCYTDAWPFFVPLLTVFDPDMIAQFAQEGYLPKHKWMRNLLYPLAQNRDLVTSEGRNWKVWRARFNPGFSARNLMSLVPAMLEEVLVFRKWMDSVAGVGNRGGEGVPDEVERVQGKVEQGEAEEGEGEIVRLEDRIMLTTIDIMGRAIL
jgi:cytochrome P450